ncbi:unnamed protein product [Closterium sp. NIES-65]|nr:unnamed protein product [Closterium sp. NIES-65]
MRHVLFKHSSHSGVPISRDELNKVISAQLAGRRVTGLPGVIIKEAQARFPAALGFEMKELERGTRGRGGGGGGGGHDGDEGGERGGEDGGGTGEEVGGEEGEGVRRMQAAGSAFTTVVCALIKGAGGSIPAEKLWALLGAMGVRRGEERHPQFGNVEESLKRMEKQRYVILVKGARGAGGEEEWTYELAEHARQGIGAEKLQKLFNEVRERGFSCSRREERAGVNRVGTAYELAEHARQGIGAERLQKLFNEVRERAERLQKLFNEVGIEWPYELAGHAWQSIGAERLQKLFNEVRRAFLRKRDEREGRGIMSGLMSWQRACPAGYWHSLR